MPILSTTSPPMVAHLSRAMSMPSSDFLQYKMSTAKTFHITSPSISTVWHRGAPALIQWECTSNISEVRLVLLRTTNANAYAIVADHVENNGFFVFSHVPTTLPSGDDYFLRILSMDGHHGADTSCFSIRS
ncbi:hypothetical protein DYB30_006649 [Aphanomyces astaci]|uniref:Yeast cell wall synthesis Kre9/Knh1-like N-terminal domain-containing protein n=1 Tax=Aphanomyces astaci TaxID=112090 RepID=A0A397E685_APHAT|nr:hypothetical protein DYB38_006055 [Aphanomyces astaci]RHY77146.1 hypothetical protein DYB30_006649 [Aphanomyces astaci]